MYMNKFLFVLALSLSLASFAFAEKNSKDEKGKYYAACKGDSLVVYDENGDISSMPTTKDNIDTTKQSIKEFNETLFKCGKKPNRSKKHKK